MFLAVSVSEMIAILAVLRFLAHLLTPRAIRLASLWILHTQECPESGSGSHLSRSQLHRIVFSSFFAISRKSGFVVFIAHYPPPIRPSAAGVRLHTVAVLADFEIFMPVFIHPIIVVDIIPIEIFSD